MKAGQKLLESEQMDCRGSWSGTDHYFVGSDVCGCVDGSDGFDGSNGFGGGFDGFDGLDGFDGT